MIYLEIFAITSSFLTLMISFKLRVLKVVTSTSISAFYIRFCKINIVGYVFSIKRQNIIDLR